jgi:Carbohydrate-binding family 9
MKHIEVPFYAGIGKDENLAATASLLDKGTFHPIDIQPWPDRQQVPQARFAIAHSGDCLFIKFEVAEKYVRATYRQSNEPVYKDSCVEFFLAPGDGQAYYNFEFNCIGTCLLGYGTKETQERHYLPAALIDKIKRQALLKAGEAKAADRITWELTVGIPVEVFCYHDLTTLQGLKGRANFYKCGDDLPEPHFLVWNEIKAQAPNFHLPEFFGEILFR